MFGVLLALILGVVLYVIVSRWTDREALRPVLTIVMGGYIVRLILQSFVRDIPFFSHGVGGDNQTYENWARAIVLIWEHSGFEYITQDQFENIGQTSLPPNLFALVFLLNGEPSRIGCTALVAIAACLTCFNVYRLAIEFGAEEPFARRVLLLTLFGPAFLLYSSDLYKDGLVAFFVIGALGSAFRLSRKLSAVHVVIGVSCLFALWFVRYYLIFVTLIPLIVGLSGINSRSLARPTLAALLILAVGIFLVSYTGIFSRATETVGATFDVGTGRDALEEKASGGSGVRFNDGGNPFGQLYLKLAYTLLSPFPWQLGSIGMQIGKIDAFVWYYLLYKAFKAGRTMFKTDRQLLLMFLAFQAPTTLMYALGMSNIGLVVRERLPIVLFTGVLAALSVRREPTPEGDEASEGTDTTVSAEST